MVEKHFAAIKIEAQPELEANDEWRKATLGFDEAWQCTNRLAEETAMLTKTKKQMKDAFAKLDYDGDEQITLEEMIVFERGR